MKASTKFPSSCFINNSGDYQIACVIWSAPQSLKADVLEAKLEKVLNSVVLSHLKAHTKFVYSRVHGASSTEHQQTGTYSEIQKYIASSRCASDNISSLWALDQCQTKLSA